MTREEIIAYMEQKSYRPLAYQELKEVLQVEDDSAFAACWGAWKKKGCCSYPQKQIRAAVDDEPGKRGYFHQPARFWYPDPGGRRAGGICLWARSERSYAS